VSEKFHNAIRNFAVPDREFGAGAFFTFWSFPDMDGWSLSHFD
jgi:hypothetical protein